MNPPDPISSYGSGGPQSSSSTTPHSDNPPTSVTTGGAPRHTSVRQMLRQQRELEEKRKFGLAPLAVDAVTHTEISPNIPQSISRAPWYYGATGPTLDHQRKHDGHRDDRLEDHVTRAVTTGQATKFTPGACQNCGSRTHKTNECVRVKKKVGTVYTNHVTGKDVVVESTTTTHAVESTASSSSEPTYAQKRDRFAGEIKIDLFDLYAKGDAASGAAPPAPTTTATSSASISTPAEGDADGNGPVKRRRLGQDVFRAQTAQHGGVEAKELPKYLQNLDAMLDGSMFFDPKTGSMRGNPNVHDPTALFQGDMKRAQTGGHDDYLETQHRFITGESKSFVDFDYDDMMHTRRAQELQEQRAQAAKSTRVESAHELLVRSLYGDSATTTTSTTATATSSEKAAEPKKAVLKDLLTATAEATMSAEAVEEARVARLAADWSACIEDGQAHRHGHTTTFGSYFDLQAGQWGYRCCHKLGEEAAPCVAGEKDH